MISAYSAIIILLSIVLVAMFAGFVGSTKLFANCLVCMNMRHVRVNISYLAKEKALRLVSRIHPGQLDIHMKILL